MYTFQSRIRYSETDCNGKLSMASLLNYFQDCSTFQSEDLNLGVAVLKKQNMVWVLASWQIVVDRYPALGEEVVIGTLPYEFKLFLGNRNFVMRTQEGEQLAVANTVWTLLNAETGKPTPATPEMLTGYRLEERLPMEYAPRKIAIPEDGYPADPIVVKTHHLDTNQHVNNGQYVAIAMQFLPADFVIGQLRAEYKMQAFLNDIFYPYVVSTEDKCIVSLADEEGKAYAVVEFERKE